MKSSSRSPIHLPHIYCHSRYDGSPPFQGELEMLEEALANVFDLGGPRPHGAFLAVDHDPKALRLAKRSGIPRARRYLIVREPRQVHPFSHSAMARRNYASIFFLGFPKAGALDYAWPYFPPHPISTYQGDLPRLERVVAIAAWKVSFLEGELYSIRSKAFSQLNVDLYGRGWSKNWSVKAKEVIANLVIAILRPRLFQITLGQIWEQPTNYLGEAADKSLVLSRYKVSLVIENSRDYFSEKLFDCIFCKTIPVYCGPSTSLLDMPDGLVVRIQPNVKDIEAGLAKALAMDYQKWLLLAEAWLKKMQEEQNLLASGVWKKVVGKIAEDLEGGGIECNQ